MLVCTTRKLFAYHHAAACDVLYCAQGLIPAVRTSTSRSVLASAKAQLLMALQDEDVGAVLGKKGQTLTQIQQVSSMLRV